MLAIFAAGAAYVYIVKTFNVGIPCVFNRITKLRCPGCGVSRMLLSLWEFDVKSAIKYNYFLFLASPAFAYIIIAAIFNYVTNKKPSKCFNTVVYILLLLCFVWFVLRNVSGI